MGLYNLTHDFQTQSMLCIAITFLRAGNIFVAVQRVQLRLTHAVSIIRNNENAAILMDA